MSFEEIVGTAAFHQLLSYMKGLVIQIHIRALHPSGKLPSDQILIETHQTLPNYFQTNWNGVRLLGTISDKSGMCTVCNNYEMYKH